MSKNKTGKSDITTILKYAENIKATLTWKGGEWWKALEFKLENLTKEPINNPKIEFITSEPGEYRKNTGFQFNEHNGVITGYLSDYMNNIPPFGVVTFSLGVSFSSPVTNPKLPTNIKINDIEIDNTVPVPPVPDVFPPNTPMDVEIVKATSNTLEVKWKASEDNIGVEGYKVIYSTPDGGTTEVNTHTNNITLIGLKPNTEYKVMVKSYDSAGNESGMSEVSTAHTSSIDSDIPHNNFYAASFVDLTAWPTPNLNKYKELTGIEKFYLGFCVAATNIKGYNLSLKDNKAYLTNTVDEYQYYINIIDETKILDSENVQLFNQGGCNIALADLPDISAEYKSPGGLYWGGFITIYDNNQGKTCSGRVSDNEYCTSSISEVKSIVSEGGASGLPLPAVVMDVNTIAQEYIDILKIYQGVDFDYEGGFLGNTEALNRHTEAIKIAKQTYPNAKITYTLPVDIDGFSSEGLNFIQLLKNYGIGPKEKIQATFNLMVMELRGNDSMINSCIAASKSASLQIANIYEININEVNQFIELCPMYGKNNNGKIYDLTTHEKFVNFAKEEGYGGFNGWDMNRDLMSGQQIGIQDHASGEFGNTTADLTHMMTNTVCSSVYELELTGNNSINYVEAVC